MRKLTIFASTMMSLNAQDMFLHENLPLVGNEQRKL